MDDTTNRYLESLKQAATGVVVQEVLSRADDAKKPLKEQAFYELKIQDSTESWQPGFDVIQWRISWSEIDNQFMGMDEEIEHWSSLQTAKNRYETRLKALKEQGFVHSDVDL